MTIAVLRFSRWEQTCLDRRRQANSGFSFPGRGIEAPFVLASITDLNVEESGSKGDCDVFGML